MTAINVKIKIHTQGIIQPNHETIGQLWSYCMWSWSLQLTIAIHNTFNTNQ